MVHVNELAAGSHAVVIEKPLLVVVHPDGAIWSAAGTRYCSNLLRFGAAAAPTDGPELRTKKIIGLDPCCMSLPVG